MSTLSKIIGLILQVGRVKVTNDYLLIKVFDVSVEVFTTEYNYFTNY